jgi:hypothetical protein
VCGFCVRSEQQLELGVKTMMQKLQPLWDEEIQVTFSLICPPGSTDRITAMITFELLLCKYLTELKMLFITAEKKIITAAATTTTTTAAATTTTLLLLLCKEF